MWTWEKILIIGFRFRGLWCKGVDELINGIKSCKEIMQRNEQENKNGREKEAELY